MAKKPRRPRVGPRNPNSEVYGFPKARLTVRAKGVARGRCGKRFTGRTLNVRDVDAGRGLLSPMSPTIDVAKDTRHHYPKRLGVYPKDHPIMVRARELAERN